MRARSSRARNLILDRFTCRIRRGADDARYLPPYGRVIGRLPAHMSRPVRIARAVRVHTRAVGIVETVSRNDILLCNTRSRVMLGVYNNISCTLRRHLASICHGYIRVLYYTSVCARERDRDRKKIFEGMSGVRKIALRPFALENIAMTFEISAGACTPFPRTDAASYACLRGCVRLPAGGRAC